MYHLHTRIPLPSHSVEFSIGCWSVVFFSLFKPDSPSDHTMTVSTVVPADTEGQVQSGTVNPIGHHDSISDTVVRGVGYRGREDIYRNLTIIDLILWTATVTSSFSNNIRNNSVIQ